MFSIYAKGTKFIVLLLNGKMTHHHIKRGRSLHQKAFLHPPNCFICKITLRGFRFGTILTKETFGFLGFITKQQLLGQP